MFCPKCDRVYVKRTVCPHCGVELLRAKGKPKGKEYKLQHDAQNDIEKVVGITCPYCGSPNRNEECCEYCGMPLAEKVSENKNKRELSENLTNAASICCPKCKSKKVFIHEKDWHHPFMRGKSAILALIMIALYLYQRIFRTRTEYVCLDCGHKWT